MPTWTGVCKELADMAQRIETGAKVQTTDAKKEEEDIKKMVAPITEKRTVAGEASMGLLKKRKEEAADKRRVLSRDDGSVVIEKNQMS